MSETTEIDVKHFRDANFNVYGISIMLMNKKTWQSNVQKDWIEITFEEAQYLTTAPTVYHEMIDGTWIENKDKKRDYFISENTLKRDELSQIAESEILILERKVKFKRATKHEIELLDLLYVYTIDLSELDLTQEDLVFPQKPE